MTHMHLSLAALALLSTGLLAPDLQAQSTVCHADFDNPRFQDNVSMGGPVVAIKTTLPNMNMVPTRLEIFTGEAGGIHALAIWSHDAVANQPALKLTEARWSGSTVNGWQGVNVPPIPLIGGQIVWVAWTPVGNSQASVENTGGNLPGIQEYRGSFNGGQTWNGPFKDHQWKFRIYCGGRPGHYEAFGLSCSGSGRLTPELGFLGLPALGRSMTVQLQNGLANTAAIMTVGISNTNWLGLPLPFDLALSGAHGCNLYASGQVLVVGATNAAGSLGNVLSIPNDSSLTGGAFFNQFWVYDPSANPLGFAFTNGGKGLIGD
jgi:hypothetical protein